MARSLLKAGLPLAVVSILSVLGGMQLAGADEGDCNFTRSNCDMQERKTFLRAQIWSGADCKPSQWATLPHSAFPFDAQTGKLETGPRAPAHFLSGVCHLLSPVGNLDEGISEIQQAQTVGLMSSQKNVASLFEGLMHCGKLKQIKDRYGDKVRDSLSAREAFCVDRSMAKASFGRVAWTNLELDYETTSTLSLGAQIDQMSACYRDYLHGGYDAMCGIITAPSAQQVLTTATTTADEVLANYFGNATGDGTTGDHGVPPLKAMLARKIQMADSALKGSDKLFATLTTKSDLLAASYRGVASEYCDVNNLVQPTCAGPIPARVAKLDDAYEHAVLAAEDVLQFVDQFLTGQYELNGKDVRKGLKDNNLALGDTLARLKDPRTNELTLGQKLERVKSNMTELLGSDVSAQTTVRRVCSIYFCELRKRTPPGFNNACAQFDATLGAVVRDVNKLCEADPTLTTVAPGQTAYSVCQGAGFPVDLMTRASMSGAQVDTCMAQHHP
jgi:hypothetical protein